MTVLLDSYVFTGYGYHNIYSAFLLTGFAITFAGLWLLRGKYPTDWAKYPALSLLVLAVLTLMIGGTTTSSPNFPDRDRSCHPAAVFIKEEQSISIYFI